jgi:type 1 glutamine amidotransferase
MAPRISQGARRAVLLCLTLVLGAARADAARVRQVLFFTKSSGYEHDAIKEAGGQPGIAARVLAELGPRHGVAFTMSKDGSKFTPAYLAQFDAFLFFTSGDLLSPGTDGNPPMTIAGKAALLAAVAGGKGFIGVHSASDTFHAGDQGGADPYLQMLGGEFVGHGAQQNGRMRVADGRFPGFEAAGGHFDLVEEWYAMRSFAPDLHVLLVQETAHMGDPDPGRNNGSYRRPPYPSTWARRHGRGRVFYTAMGHRQDVWTSPLFQQILFGGVDWVTGDQDADTGPNLADAAPRAAEMPPAK